MQNMTKGNETDDEMGLVKVNKSRYERGKRLKSWQNPYTEAKRNFARHSELLVKIKDEAYASIVLRDIWSLRIHDWRFLEWLHQVSIRSLFEKL